MPNRLRFLIPFVVLVAVTALLWFLNRDPSGSPTSVPTPSAGLATSSDPNGSSVEAGPIDPNALPTPGSVVDQTNNDPRFTRFTDGTVHLTQAITASRALHQSPDPRADLEIIDQLLGDFRLIYKENPVGTENAEIVDQLRGKNPKKIVFVAPGISALSPEGSLLDRWGSPYIFHPLKADVMDIRSPGPDRKPWTDDDLSLDLQDVEAELQLRSGR
jgi:hypothetical protein